MSIKHLYELIRGTVSKANKMIPLCIYLSMQTINWGKNDLDI
jgi:hypothetical protein